MNNYKAMYKYELAAAAGVSPSTLRNWLRDDKPALRAMGVRDSNRLLPPVAVKYICDKYCIHIQDNTNAIR